MAYQAASIEKRLQDNITNYRLEHLFDVNALNEYVKCIARETKTGILLLSPKGERYISSGEFADFRVDIEKEPGRCLQVGTHTLAHLYIAYSKETLSHDLERFFDLVLEQLKKQAETEYRLRETSIYLDELEEKLRKQKDKTQDEKQDGLTGMLSDTYFESRLKVVDRSEVLPVGFIVGNINDWKYANDHYGDKESDRLIKMIATICMEEAKQDYIIGRVDGDIFHVLIPMAEENELIEYCNRVSKRCLEIQDEILAPSIAMGYVIKTNVEQELETLVSDAEYEMFQNKLEQKNAPGYQERLIRSRTV